MFSKKHLRLGKVSIELSAVIVFFILLFDISIRLALIFHNWPETDSDEGTVGLMALHISHLHDFPIYFYSQGWMGSLEAYIGAALFLILGPTVIAMRIGVLLLYIVFLICIYILTRLLYSKGLALVTVAILGLGTPEIFKRAIAAYAGHPETPLFGTLIVLLSTLIGLASQNRYRELEARQRRRLVLLYTLWGCAAGAAYWNDPLAATFIFMGAVFLLVCCHKTLRAATLAGALLGLFIGLLPVLINDINVPLVQKSFTSAGFLIDTGGPIPYDSLLSRVAAAFFVTLPVSTGATGVCTFQNWQTVSWPITSHSSPYVLQCTAAHGIWAFGMIATWLAAVLMEVSVPGSWWSRIKWWSLRWWSLIRKQNTRDDDGSAIKTARAESPLEEKVRVLRLARLMLLGSAGLTWLVFALSAQAIDIPWGNNRYLIGLTAATPALLWPLWRGLQAIIRKPPHFSPALLKTLLSAIILICYVGGLVAGTIDTFNAAPSSGAATQQDYALADTLVTMHLKHIYADYWTCDLVIFLSREQIICSVLDPQLKTGVNRYTPYVVIVASDPQASYVFPVGSPQSQAFIERIQQTGKPYKITHFEKYMIYQPQY